MINRTVIVGAGAMGCLFAARLARAGLDVTLVDVDPDRMALINREGLRLVDDTGEFTVRVSASVAHHVRAPVDLVIIFTKGIHTRDAAASVQHLCDANPTVLTLQNGSGNAELIAKTFATETIVVGTAHVPADIELPNTVFSGGFEHIVLGDFDAAGGKERAREVAAILRLADFETELSANIDYAIWDKLAFNAALNALAMITKSNNGGLDNPFARRIAGRLVDETVRVANARGTGLDANRILAVIERALTEHSSHKASMLQDREAGRETEIEFINGAVIREGERLGIETPTHAALFDLVKTCEFLDSNKYN